MTHLSSGTYVRSELTPEWDLGRVIGLDGDNVLVYFKGRADPNPDMRVSRFPQSAGFLKVVDGVSDPDLDNLPPYTNGKFQRASTSLTLKRAKELFLRAFPLGFADPAYLAPTGTGEREYKLAAHRRFKIQSAGLGRLAELGTGSEIRAAIENIYQSPNEKELQSLNLMHPRFEAPMFFDALDDDTFARSYLQTSCEFIETPSALTFEGLASVLERLPSSAQSRRIGKWPFLTWLPFIADPEHHMIIRPRIASGFASILPFEIHYRSELDYQMYSLVIAMSERLAVTLANSEVNKSRRPLDMIDMQSFMWVVQRYFQPSALEGAS